MSGPKSSRYTLTAEQLRKIMAEQERLRKELEEKARKARELKEAKEYLSAVREKTTRLLKMVKDSEQMALSSGAVLSAADREAFIKFNATVEKIHSVSRIASSNDYPSVINARNQAQEYYAAIAEKAEELIHATSERLLQQRIKNDERISFAMQSSFAFVGAIEDPQDPEREEIINELKGLLDLDIPESLKSEVGRVIEQFEAVEDTSTRRNYYSITIEPLKKRCIASDSFRRANRDRFAAALDRYHALCIQLDEMEESFDYTWEGLAELEKVITEYEQRAIRIAEQEYISHSVDEVMRDMGYEVIGQRSVHKKSGKTFKSKLLTYEDGTVVNVTESSNGQITMEIGGVDETDRLPDASERVSLQKTMEAFCKDFKEIECRLSEKGVVLDSRLSMAPPEEAFAQIINISDYELAEGFQAGTAKKNKASKTQKSMQLGND